MRIQQQNAASYPMVMSDQLAGEGPIASMLWKGAKAVAPHLLPAVGSFATKVAEGLGEKLKKLFTGGGSDLTADELEQVIDIVKASEGGTLQGGALYLPGDMSTRHACHGRGTELPGGGYRVEKN